METALMSFQIKQLVNIASPTILKRLRQSHGNEEAALAALLDENNNRRTEQLSMTADNLEQSPMTVDNSEQSPTSTASSPQSADLSEMTAMETQLLDTIGENTGHYSQENRYANSDLTNEILAFNK